jgi:hypothetical protein
MLSLYLIDVIQVINFKGKFMKRFICVICVFVGIFAYNLYTPTLEKLALQKWGVPYCSLRTDLKIELQACRETEVSYGMLIGLFFSGMTYFGLSSLCNHRKDRQTTS